MVLSSVLDWFPHWKNVQRNVSGVQCLFTAQMTTAKTDVKGQVAGVFVNQLPRLSELVIKLITRVIDFTSTKLQVTLICLSKSNKQTLMKSVL